MFAMVSEPNVLFLLDEPESHFNPRWRVEFLSKLLETPTHTGKRSSEAPSASQEVLITTHAPFLPSDMPREQVLIFERDDDDKVSPRWPDIQTFGASYEGILESCFKISPPLSGLPRRFIDDLMNSNNTKDIEDGLTQLGSSVEKILLADHLDNLKES
jgi:predicted ATP-binding protein involved in virulence